jgi:hypothetical protein
MKLIKIMTTTLLLFLFFGGIIYGAFAFGKWNINPQYWGCQRSVAALFIFIALCASVLLSVAIYEHKSTGSY